MSLVTNMLGGMYLVERLVEIGIDDAGASQKDYQDILGFQIAGHAQVIGSTQFQEVSLGGQQESRLRHRFYCEYGFDLKRGDRITRTDQQYSVIYILNVSNMQTIAGQNDHTLCVCEELQKGEKLR